MTLINKGRTLTILSKLSRNSFWELSFEKCLMRNFCFLDCLKRVSKCFEMPMSPLVKAANNLWRILSCGLVAFWIRNLRWFDDLHLIMDFKNGLLFLRCSSKDRMCSFERTGGITADHWSNSISYIWRTLSWHVPSMWMRAVAVISFTNPSWSTILK